jgi:hypothetical protein
MRHLILLAGVLWLALALVGVPAAQHAESDLLLGRLMDGRLVIGLTQSALDKLLTGHPLEIPGGGLVVLYGRDHAAIRQNLQAAGVGNVPQQ